MFGACAIATTCANPDCRTILNLSHNTCRTCLVIVYVLRVLQVLALVADRGVQNSVEETEMAT